MARKAVHGYSLDGLFRKRELEPTQSEDKPSRWSKAGWTKLADVHAMLAALEEASPTRRYHALARANIARWAAQAKAAAAAEGAGGEGAGGEGGEGGCSVLVLPGDWGAVALEMSRRFAAPAARSSRPAAVPLDLRVW